MFKKFLPIGKTNTSFFQVLINDRLLKFIKENWLTDIFSILRRNPLYTNEKYIKFLNLNKIKKKKNNKAFRLRNNLPLRGQRTHTNAKTRKERNVQ